MYQRCAPHSEDSLTLIVIMHSPRPPSATLFPSGHHHHVEARNDTHAFPGHHQPVDENVIGWPWCQSCRPFVQILLGQGMASIAGPSAAGSWALSSPFPEYVCVPALVHRSQLALFAPSATLPASPTLSPQGQMGSAVRSSSASARQRKPRGCTNCRLANKKCDDGRPCERCRKNGLELSCVSAERKPRKRTVRQTATTTMTVSATQVSMERTTIPKDDPTPTTVHVAAGTSYVDDSQENTDAATHSSPSGSSATAGDFDNQPDVATPPSYALHANFWASLQPFPTAASDAQFPNWSFNSQDHTPFFGHGMSSTAADDHRHGLSPTGLEGSSAFQSAGQHF
ncbi:hypothetical protein LXA43DRAFT_1180517 [Ganoderma leucocontextum]|nr:hypothetical protein LXA43DRAFT_1180517 [Ganoderma leucocontextum]